MKRFWKWVCLFAYRQWATSMPKMPIGVPFYRDIDNPCPAYEPRRKLFDDFSECQSDGHFLCRECCHYNKDRLA